MKKNLKNKILIGLAILAISAIAGASNKQINSRKIKQTTVLATEAATKEKTPKVASVQVIDEQSKYNPHLNDAVVPASDSIVTLKEGKLQGSKHDGIYQYLGVPYAEAKERFVKAKPVTPWKGVKQALKYGNQSLQTEFLSGKMLDGEGYSNDALNLNIWTPSLNKNAKKPVMVWFHGGGFSSGSANEAHYDGENLSKIGDVVVVTVNHRLNMLGYFDLSAYGEKYRNSGNLGIVDLMDSLTWVKENIAQFGGDPNNVTIFGESGGGAKVTALMASPEAKGLFHKAIIESGATNVPDGYFLTEKVSKALTERILQKLNIDKNNLDKLQTLPYGEMYKVAQEAQKEIAQEYKLPASIGEGYSLAWRPVADGKFISSNPLISNQFAVISKDIPLLIGSNLNEWTTFMPNLRHANITAEQKAMYAKAYPNENPEDADLVDTLIRLAMLRIMTFKSDQNGAPVYSYVFTKQVRDAGSYHTSEIPFVFNNNKDETELSRQMATAWANFARYGKPTAPGLPEWKPYERKNRGTMILDDKSEYRENHDSDLIKSLEPNFKY